MKFIKGFKLYLESVDNLKSYKGWTVRYNHNDTHDLNKKLADRCKIKDSEFESIIKVIIDKSVKDNLDGDYTFISLTQEIKIVTKVKLNKSIIDIITILGKNEKVKPKDKIILI